MTKRIMSINDAIRIREPVVYGLINDDNELFYVGRTGNPQKRFAHYKNGRAHGNAELESRIKGGFNVFIFAYSPADINKLEQDLIAANADSIVNVIGCGISFENNRKVKPWFAGSGVKCPSDYLMHSFGRKSDFKEVIRLRDKLSDVDRSAYEVGVYKDMHKIQQSRMAQWFESCRDRLLWCMEHG